MKCCIDCSEHQIQLDPDPLDWFCDDDIKVYCKKAKKNATVACRPYMDRTETTPPPKWCPLNKKTKDKKNESKRNRQSK